MWGRQKNFKDLMNRAEIWAKNSNVSFYQHPLESIWVKKCLVKKEISLLENLTLKYFLAAKFWSLEIVGRGEGSLDPSSIIHFKEEIWLIMKKMEIMALKIKMNPLHGQLTHFNIFHDQKFFCHKFVSPKT